jgi:hypothetical protein
MSHPDLITTSIWDEPGNVDLLKRMWTEEGASASEIARAMGQGITRASVIGKVHRLKLPKRDNAIRARPDRVTRNTTPLITGKKGRSGNPGVPSVQSIKHRIEGRDKAERSRQEGKISHFGHEPFREGRLPVEDGVDVTGLIAFSGRRINQQCAWIPGSPLDGALCCGKPVVEGTQWCETHHARVYPRGQ